MNSQFVLLIFVLLICGDCKHYVSYALRVALNFNIKIEKSESSRIEIPRIRAGHLTDDVILETVLSL